MLYSSKKAVRNEAINKAEQTLKGTVLRIDNTLLMVEQATRLMLWNVENHLDDPDIMIEYTRKMLQKNPSISGCAIAFDPNYYKGRDTYFMAYSYLNKKEQDSIKQAKLFGGRPHADQVWFSVARNTGQPYWTEPLTETDPNGDYIMSYCLPVRDRQGETVAVLAVDVQINWLSKAIYRASEVSSNSCSMLLNCDGTFIVQPLQGKLSEKDIKAIMKCCSDDVAQAREEGKNSYQRIHRDGSNYLVFYQPLECLDWTVGIVYPEFDILTDYYKLRTYVILIAHAGVVVLLVLCLLVTFRQLKPLLLLTKKAQRIADGHFDEPIPESSLQCEIGQLQNNFKLMQQSLSAQIGELKQLSDTLKEQGEVLREAYKHTQEADEMKTAFLHNVTDYIMSPISAISNNINILRDRFKQMEQEEVNRVVGAVLFQGEAVADLLNDLLDESQKKSETE